MCETTEQTHRDAIEKAGFSISESVGCGGVFCVAAVGPDGQKYIARTGSRYESLVELAEMVRYDLKDKNRPS